MKKVLIFGGYGFIGNNLFNELKQKYIVKRYTSFKNQKKNRIKYNYKNFFEIIKNFKPDVVFFLSGTSNPDYSNKKYLIDLKKTNLILQSLLYALKNFKFKGKMFFFSSIGVYGSSSKKKVNEENILNPESFYTLSKLIAEKQCDFFRNHFNLNINILRICSIFGPNLRRQIIYKIIKKVNEKNKIIKLLGNINDKRELLFIEDLIIIIKKLMLSNVKKQTLNIGSNKQFFIKDIVNKVLKISKKNKKVYFLNKIKTPKLGLLNNKKLHKYIKFKKNLNLDLGLKKTFLYYK